MRIVRLLLALALLTLGAGLVAAPVAGAYPSGVSASATINATVFHRGDTVTVAVSNAAPGGVLTMTLESTPVVIASGVVVGHNFRTSISGVIPADTTLEPHQIIVNSTKGESFNFAITVVADTAGPRGSFVYSCVGEGRAQFGFTGTGFEPRARYSLLVGSTVVAAARASSGIGNLEIYTETDLGPGEVDVSVVGAGQTYAGVLSDVQCGVAPTLPASSSPNPQPSTSPGGSDVVTVTASASTAGSGTALASTGAQVGLGVGVGGVLLAGGTLLVLASRRRPGAHRH